MNRSDYMGYPVSYKHYPLLLVCAGRRCLYTRARLWLVDLHSICYCPY